MSLLVEAVERRGEEAVPKSQDEALVFPPSVTELIYYKFGDPNSWPAPRVAVYSSPRSILQEGNSVELPRRSADSDFAVVARRGAQRLSGYMLDEKDPLLGKAVALEAFNGSYLDDGTASFDNDAIAVTVFDSTTYGKAHIPDPELRSELYGRYGVLPADDRRVWFQGVLSSKEGASQFTYVPKNIATNGVVDAKDRQQQLELAGDFLGSPYEGNPDTTAFGMVVSQAGLQKW